MPATISVEYGLRQALPDGTRLNADVYAPATPGKYPTLLMRLPYGAEIASAVVFRHPAWYAARGFCVVVQEVRGSGRSGGGFYPLRDEQADSLAALEWAAALPRANGRVGMYGFSYQGAVQLQAAAGASAALRCVAPSMTASDFYQHWHYEGGVPLYGSSLGWALQLATISALHDGRDADAARLRRAATNVDALFSAVPPLPAELCGVAWAQDWFAHESDDGYWQSQRVPPSPALPGLWSAGWYDTFLAGTLAAHAAASAPASAPQSLLIGPWQHLPWTRVVGGRDFGAEAWSPLDELQARFFAACLRDEAPPEPLTAVFVTGEDRWRAFAGWPPPAQTLRLDLMSDGDAAGQPGGRLLREGPAAPGCDVFVSEPLTPVASLGGHGGGGGRAIAAGCFEQFAVESRREVLLYTSEPLSADTLVAGPVTAYLTIASSADDCDWIARLCDVDETGRSFNITQGALRSRCRNGFATPEPLLPNAETPVTVSLRQCGHLFRAGHRIRLVVAGSSFPHYGRNPGVCRPVCETPASAYRAAVQHVLHGQGQRSWLELPIVPLEAAELWSPSAA